MRIDMRTMRCATALFLALMLGACAHVNHLRDAQQTFSETAALENQSRSSGGTVPSSVQAGYSSVVLSLQKLEQDGDSEKRLKADNLWGNVQMLKALAYWRLGNYDKARESRNQLGGSLPPGSRDHALSIALEGFIKNDEAFAKFAKLPKPTGDLNDEAKAALMEEIRELVLSADDDLTRASEQIPEAHALNSYLALNGLGAMSNLSVACNKLNKGDKKQAKCFEKTRERDPDKQPPDRSGPCRVKAWEDKLKALGVAAADVKAAVGKLSTECREATPAPAS